jgi:predicted phage terminase large subunit-like protein
MKALTPAEIDALLAGLHLMTAAEQEETLAELEALETQQRLERCRNDFLAFCHHVYDGFKEGPHHRHLLPLLHNVNAGTENRLTVSMPPRFGKSETIAYLFVAWYLGHNPTHHIMMATHTADLSASFGRKVRNLIDSPQYHEIFPETVVSRDKSAADNWTTTKGGKYLAIGIGGNVAGHGAHLLIADDLVSEQAVLANPDAAFETAWTYMQVGPLQRLMPGGRIIMIGTRWGKKDPIGRALTWAAENPDSAQWNEVRFPAVMKVSRDGAEQEISLWPEQWPVEQLQAKRAGMQPQFWAAQYMQEPTSEEGALLKREWWRIWDKPKPPPCDYILITVDTAHETKNRSDYSVFGTWGVFYNEQTERNEIILLNVQRARWEFPDLKHVAFEHMKDWEPDTMLIEKKAAGAPLIQEMRQAGLFIEESSPSRGKVGVSNDKRARVNAVSSILQDGCCWIPDKRWAWELVEECASFPNGEHDDMVDVTEMALSRFRRGGFLSLVSDKNDDFEWTPPQRREAYY